MAGRERVVYLNGEYVPETDAKISIFDSALMFGDMVFEMTRSFRKKQHLLDKHLERLFRSVQCLCIPLKMTLRDIEAAINTTIERNASCFDEEDEHRVMVNVSRGPLSLYAEVFGGRLEPTVVISVFPVKWTVASFACLYDTGVHAVIPSQRMIPARLLEPKVKNRSRLHYMMANIEIERMKDPTAWALLVDDDGFICEGTGANFFIVKDHKLITPEPRNILRGIKRGYVMKLAQQAGIEVIETNLESYDVMEADEAFFTSTAFSMMPCTRFQGRPIGEGKMGPITEQLLDAWNQDVKVNIIEQTKRFASSLNQHLSSGTTPYRFVSK